MGTHNENRKRYLCGEDDCVWIVDSGKFGRLFYAVALVLESINIIFRLLL